MSEARLRILVVDDEPAIRRFLLNSLTGHGYEVLEAATGMAALDMAALHKPDLIILDLGLPDMEGAEVTRRLREWTQLPIIILSVREHETDKIIALDAGADDYLTKPFSMGELLARIRAAMRRTGPLQTEPVFIVAGLKVDLDHRTVHLNDREIQLTPTEYDLLRALVLHAGHVRTHRQLLAEVWGAAYVDEMHLLRVNVSNLRRKIETDATRPYFLITEPGVGYRLRAE